MAAEKGSRGSKSLDWDHVMIVGLSMREKVNRLVFCSVQTYMHTPKALLAVVD